MLTKAEEEFAEKTGFYSQIDMDYALSSIRFHFKFTKLDEKCPNCGETLYAHKSTSLKICLNCQGGKNDAN